MTEHLRTTASCVYRWILKSFSEHLFYEHLWESTYFMYQVPEFLYKFMYLQVPELQYSKKLFHRWFQAFCTKPRSSHSKEFIYLKSLKIMWKLIRNEVARCQPASLRKKLFHRFSFIIHVFCLNFLRSHHDYFFRKGFESVREQFLSGNISEK